MEQDYPEKFRNLIVLDDSGELRHWQLPNREVAPLAQIAVVPERFGSITEKYNAMLGMCRYADIVCVWEDDDIYMPWHISSIVRTCPILGWVKPDEVMSLYTGTLVREPAAGRFHASLGASRFLLDSVGGWPATRRADFDQKLMSNLDEAGRRVAPDYRDRGAPSYIFRWGSTQAQHGQEFMRSPACTNWWEEAGRRIPSEGSDIVVTPKMDDETKAIYEKFKLNPRF